MVEAEMTVTVMKTAVLRPTNDWLSPSAANLKAILARVIRAIQIMKHLRIALPLNIVFHLLLLDLTVLAPSSGLASFRKVVSVTTLSILLIIEGFFDGFSPRTKSESSQPAQCASRLLCRSHAARGAISCALKCKDI